MNNDVDLHNLDANYQSTKNIQMSEKEAEELLNEIDEDLIDKNGNIDYESFLNRVFHQF